MCILAFTMITMIKKFKKFKKQNLHSEPLKLCAVGFLLADLVL